VEAAGELTIVVVVAVVTIVFVRPGVNADVLKSAQLVCTCTVVAADVVIRIMSLVDDNIMLEPYAYEC
jgi:hypothetical protein